MHDLDGYEELYHYEDGRSLVLNTVTQDVLMMKRLKFFDEEVYDYLYKNPCKFIPKIHDIVKTGESLIVVEDRVQGVTFDVVMMDKSLTDKARKQYFFQLLDGLEFLHSAPKPIIHRDLKPSNIMVTDKGQVMIIDYDAAKIYKADQDDDTTNLGTDGWAAPEQYGFMQSDPRTDIYAVGKMLAEAFPDNGRIQKVASKASSFDPEDRYRNVGQLRYALMGRVLLNSKLNPLWPPPGFRTLKWWKMLIALFIYVIAFFFIGAIAAEGGKLQDNLFVKALFLMLFLVILDIWCSWTGLFDLLPFMMHKNIFIRIVAKLIYSAAAFFIVIVIICLIYAGIMAAFNSLTP